MIIGPVRDRWSLWCAMFLAYLPLPLLAQQWEVFDMDNSPIPSTTVNALVEDAFGGVWIGTDWGLGHYDGEGDWAVYQVANSGIPSNNVRALALDSDQNLWIGTDADGLAFWNGVDWVTYTTMNSPIPENGIRDVFVDVLDQVWVTTSSGLACFTGSEWRIYNGTEQSYGGLVLNTGNTRAVAVREDGLVCLGTFNGGLHYLTASTVTFLNTVNDGFFDNTAIDVLFDPNTGDRWVSTPAAGLLRQQGPPVGGPWYQWNSSIGFPSNSITGISMDAQGRIWAGSQVYGLIRVDTDQSFTSFTTVNSGIPDDEVPSVLAASDGSVWVGTVYGGLARFRASVAVEEEQAGARLRIAPNPVHDRCTVVLPQENGPSTWTLLDIQGRILASSEVYGPTFQLDVSGYGPGLYMIDVGTVNGHYLRNFIVQ